MEEQRQRQEDEARRSGNAAAGEPAPAGAAAPTSNEDAMLERALAMSMDQPAGVSVASTVTAAAPAFPDFSAMTEEEQIAYAMQMSMQEARKLLHTKL